MVEIAAGSREVLLPRAGRLVVRGVEPTDVAGLTALYDALDDDSRYRRFFSGYRPRAPFFERMVTVGERGGAGLVAVVTAVDDPADPGRIVAEAGYELLPDGDGELAITVDRSWRGWLGPYLLDALVEVAAAHGVANLEADILLTNRPMLALFRARGYAAIPNQDWTVLRAMIGTATRMPRWPASWHGPRVLAEGAGGCWRCADAAVEAGFEVLACPGPDANRGCPALAGEPCPLAAGADVIVVCRPRASEAWALLRDAHRHVHPGVPVCVELPADGEAVAGEHVAPVETAEVVALVQHLAAPDEPSRGPAAK